MGASESGVFSVQQFSDVGAPLVGGRLYTYVQGTTTFKTAYTDAAALVPQTYTSDGIGGQYIALNSRGELPAPLYLTSGSYDLALKRADGSTVWTRRADPLSSASESVLTSLADTASAANGANIPAYNPALSYTLGLGAFLNFLHARTTAEIAASVTPTNYAFFEGDIRRYGATTGASNNSVAYNAALLVSSNGGAPAFIPPGTWKTTAPPACVGTSSMQGVGYGSVMQTNGCDGLTITNQGTVAGPRTFRDFQIVGSSAVTSTYSAIASNMTAASGNRATGISFERLGITNFGYGVNCIGLWNPTFSQLFLYNCYNGMIFSERSIDTRIVDCSIVKGAITGPGGTQRGIQFVQVGAIRPEDIAIRHAYVYGYDYGCDITNGLYATIEQSDFDNCQQIGIRIGTINGGMVVRDNWVNVNAASATVGIDIVASGSAIPEKVIIDGNNVTNLSPFAGSIGIKAGNQQNGVVVTNNFIRDFADGVQFNANENGICKYNNISATSRAIYLDSLGVGYEIGPNYITAGTALTFSAGRPVGLSLYASGSTTLAVAGFTSGITVTYQWAVSGKIGTLYNPSSSNGTSNATTMTTAALPVEMRPRQGGGPGYCPVRDNGVQQMGIFIIDTAGVITFGANAASILTGGGFTASAGKGITSSAINFFMD